MFSGLLRKWREKISWEWEYGLDKEDTSRYRLEFVSKPIPETTFKGLSEKYVKQAFGKSIDDVKLGESFVLPFEVIKHNEQVLLLGLPRVKPSGTKFLTKKIKEMSYRRVEGGWVIFVAVEGVRRLF
jgi:hypothetical protein